MAVTFQEALNLGDYATALSLRNTRTPYGSGDFSPFFNFLTSTGSSESPYVTKSTVFQPILIYPSGKSSTGTETFNHPTKGKQLYTSSGSWKLDDAAMGLLEERISRSLGETGVQVSPLQVKNSSDGLDIWRTDWGPATRNMGISPEEIASQSGGNVVPVYLVRGLGG